MVTPSNCEKVSAYIRSLRPKICFIPPLIERHPDHSNAGKLLLHSLFLAGLKKWPSPPKKNNEKNAWRPFHVLHYMQHATFKPDIVG